MVESKKSGRPSPFIFMVALGLAAVAMPSLTRAQAQKISASLNETKPAEVRIVSTEFRFSPATVRVAAGRTVTLVLDNRGAETEHGLFVPALGFRLQAKAGEIARKNTVFEKPGNYDYC
ncbi:MAG: cupredoxin domain-containing protein, partial [Methylocella sp.]